jgi:Flp pilus assembly pilin Flp
MSSLCRRLIRVMGREEDGQTAVEYAMVVALVGIVIAGVLAAGVTGLFTDFWSIVTSTLSSL